MTQRLKYNIMDTVNKVFDNNFHSLIREYFLDVAEMLV